MRTSLKASAAALAICGAVGLAFCASVHAAEEPEHPAALDDAIIAAAKRHGVPERLVRRIIMRESKYNPRARNHSFWGLMQISYPTARSMGFKGTPQELLNPVVNLRYAVPYLANAFVIAGKRDDAAVRLYAAGYYFTARGKGLLSALRTAESPPLNGVVEEQPVLAANDVVQPPQSVGVFGALFGPGSQPQPTQVVAYSADASAASVQPAAPPQSATAAPAGTFNSPTVAMVTDKKGELAPPKKWIRDGGTSLIARGEQGTDQLAARDHAADEASAGSRHRARKNTAFAALDVPPSTAQAYAGAPSQDSRFTATESQAAIAQATTGPAPVQQVDGTGQPVQPVSGDQVAAAPQADAADEKPTKRARTHHSRRHKPSEDRTRLADDKPADTPASPPPPVAQ